MIANVGPMVPPEPEPDPAGLPNPYPLGHYYSPVPSAHDVEVAMAAAERELPSGLDLDHAGQVAFLDELGRAAPDHVYGEPGGQGLRYVPDNGFFGISDALVLQAVLRWARPTKVVEVGSGWSSACTLDTDERFLDRRTQLTFIDPDPVRLDAILTEGDLAQPGRIEIYRQPVQEVPDEVLLDLERSDVLFIDSSHVSKAGSDVNRLLLDVVPRLPAGVLVHVHDIAFPFEYARSWLEEGRFWNEAYLLRALLTDNPRLRIRVFNNYLAQRAPDAVQRHFPAWTGDGLSLWLEVVSDPR